MHVAPYINIAAYKFITFEGLEEMRQTCCKLCAELGLKGTILLSPEGINLFIAGLRQSVANFLAWLRTDVRFADLQVKESFSDAQPFTKMLVKIKPEIITMRRPLIQPEKGRAPAVDAVTLKRWLDAGRDDEGREVVTLDTRNAFEIDVGAFYEAIDFRLTKFSEFPAVIEQHGKELANKTIVTYCTGGIRCEKAAIHMQNIGIKNVYQLDGGILKYFEEVGGAHYHGDCFVFDYRTALNSQLEPTQTTQCFACRAVVTPREQLSPFYIAGKSCPHCKKATTESSEAACC